ncbi:MAG: glycosyltransferase [Candidatus Bathycorpusculaceae bacterium]
MSVSIIIPTLNEEKLLPHVLKHLRKYEVIVVDGGSKDRTVEIARNFGAKVIISNENIPISRNIGSRLAHNEILIQLDADTILTEDLISEIIKLMRDKRVSGGTFRLYPYDGAWYHVLFLTTTALVSKLFEKVPISCKPRVSGSIIFMRKSVFNRIGGYWENPVAEDQHIAKRLASVGKFVLINKVIYTSARRWIKWGFFKAILIMTVNSWMAVMFNKTLLKTW